MVNTKGSKFGHMKGEELLVFESMKNWFESLTYCAISRGKKGMSYDAKRQRLSTMEAFSEYFKMNPDELLLEGQTDMNLAGKRLLDYFTKGVEEGKTHNTMVTRLGWLRGFYTHQDLHFPKRWAVPKLKQSKVKKKDEQNSMFKRNGNGEVELKSAVLQHFVGNLNLRDQTITLCILSSGADAKDVLNLNFEFVNSFVKNSAEDEPRMLFSGNRSKNGEPFRVYFSKEATQFLIKYANQTKIEQEFNKEQKKPYVKISDETPLFFVTDSARGNFGERLSVQSLAFAFRQSAKKMGQTKKFETSPLRPKRFRHLFRNACNYAKVSEGWCHSMMGHVSSVSQSYLEKPILELEKVYAEVEPYVTVFSVSDEKTSRQINRLTKGIANNTLKTQQLEAENQQLRERQKQLEKEFMILKELVEKSFKSH